MALPAILLAIAWCSDSFRRRLWSLPGRVRAAAIGFIVLLVLLTVGRALGDPWIWWWLILAGLVPGLALALAHWRSKRAGEERKARFGIARTP